MTDTAADAPSSRSLRRGSAVAAGLVIAVLALVPRVLILDRGFMIDERLWIDRSASFVDAATDGRFSDAFTTGHPGVTTSWIAGLAQRTLPEDATLLERYSRARLAMAAASVVLLLVVWLLARPLVGEAAAGGGAVLLAFDPLVLAHTRVVHLDGIQTLAMTASFLALLRAVRLDERRLLAASGALAGFAFLTRTFAGYLLIATVVVLWRDGRGIRRRLLIWGAAAAVVGIALWPLAWVRPWKAVSLLVEGLASGAVEDSDAGRFFLGGRIAAPGPLFYPVALALRTSVLTLPAGVLAAAWAIRRRRAEEDARRCAALLAYALGFVALLSLSFKTADRYLLPAAAALDLAVAVAAVRWLRARRARGRVLFALAVAGALALHAVPALAIHPYELAHFNWAAGGPVAAQHAIPIGRGEGLDEAARALSRMPGAAALTVATTRVTGFEEFFAGRTVRIEDSSLVRRDGPMPDLVLFYFSSVQAGRVGAVWARYRDEAPVYRLDINLIPYVRVYRIQG